MAVSTQGRDRPVRRTTRVGLAVLWSLYVLAVVSGWRAAAAPDAPEDSQLFVVAALGLAVLLLVTSWLHDRAGR
jgi:Co/Zn/Cd efflux system component